MSIYATFKPEIDEPSNLNQEAKKKVEKMSD